MSKELTIAQKKEWAQMLYLQDQLSQKEIALKVKVAEKTLSHWVTAGHWKEMRVSLLTSKEEVIRFLYNVLLKIKKQLTDDNSIGDAKTSDMFVKYTASIRNLETETSVAQLMEAGRKFHKFLQALDPAFALNVLNHYDAFIKDNLKKF